MCTHQLVLASTVPSSSVNVSNCAVSINLLGLETDVCLAIQGAIIAGEPIVLVVPASPLLATTVTPAATAASSASEIGSSLVSGNGLPPNDSLITSAPATLTA